MYFLDVSSAKHTDQTFRLLPVQMDTSFQLSLRILLVTGTANILGKLIKFFAKIKQTLFFSQVLKCHPSLHPKLKNINKLIFLIIPF